MRVSELKASTMEDLIADIFYFGIVMSGDRSTKKQEKQLQAVCKEFERRGVVSDWEQFYNKICK